MELLSNLTEVFCNITAPGTVSNTAIGSPVAALASIVTVLLTLFGNYKSGHFHSPVHHIHIHPSTSPFNSAKENPTSISPDTEKGAEKKDKVDQHWLDYRSERRQFLLELEQMKDVAQSLEIELFKKKILNHNCTRNFGNIRKRMEFYREQAEIERAEKKAKSGEN